jgi:flagellar hook assembly protein FlgD
VWDGRTTDGSLAPDGVYHPWVHLASSRHTFKFTNNITIDTMPPTVVSKGVGKTIFFAGGGRTVAITSSFDEPAHAVVYLDGNQIIVSQHARSPNTVKWAGTVDGSPLPAGTYTLSVGGRDKAGNETPPGERKHVRVVLRYVQLSPTRLSVRGGSPFRVHVTTASRYTWRLGQRHGSRRGRLLRLRAPTTPGTYRLVVTEDGQSTTAVVRVHG